MREDRHRRGTATGFWQSEIVKSTAAVRRLVGVLAVMRSPALGTAALRSTTLGWTALGTAALGLICWTSVASAAGTAEGSVRVELHDGQVLEGRLRLVEPSAYLLQTEDVLYELSGTEIAAVDGRTGRPELDPPSERLIRYESYEIIHADGQVDLWSHARVTNDSPIVWTYVKSGAAKHELDLMERLEAYDGYGHRLDHRIEPREDSDLHNVIVDLVVPIAPGEAVNISRRYTEFAQAQREGDRWTYTVHGDFPEDRIYYRKLRLPPEANLVRADPSPTVHFEHDGCTVLAWRRYYARGERYPLTVVYELEDQGP